MSVALDKSIWQMHKCRNVQFKSPETPENYHNTDTTSIKYHSQSEKPVGGVSANALHFNIIKNEIFIIE